MKEIYEKATLEQAVKESTTYADTLRYLNLRAAGGNYKILKKYIEEYEIDTSHFSNASERLKNKPIPNTIPIDQVLVENSPYSRTCLKKQLYKLNLKQRVCELCGQDENWKGKQISLILDHINGVWNDNRLENLRILCPNCNATLDTHCSKNIRKRPRQLKEKIKPIRQTKIQWPSKEELEKLVWKMPRTELAKQLGVSDVSIAKHCKLLGISQPPRGYWMKIN